MQISDPGRAAMLKAMVLTMTSDGDPEAIEQDVVRRVYADAAGGPVDEGALASLTQRAAADAEALWKELATAAELPEPEKEEVLKGAVRVVMADGELADGEMTALQKVARALAYRELRKVMNAVWKESRDRRA